MIRVRKERGLTQKELAEMMGTSQAALPQLEIGEREPSFRTIMKFAKATGTTPQLHFV